VEGIGPVVETTKLEGSVPVSDRKACISDEGLLRLPRFGVVPGRSSLDLTMLSNLEDILTSALNSLLDCGFIFGVSVGDWLGNERSFAIQ